MRFFDNSSINRLYLHSGLQGFAFNGGAVFSYVYLLKAGIANYLVFFTIAVVILLRLALRLALLPIVHRIGLRNGLSLARSLMLPASYCSVKFMSLAPGCLPICFCHPAERRFIGPAITPVSQGWATLKTVALRSVLERRFLPLPGSSHLYLAVSC